MKHKNNIITLCIFWVLVDKHFKLRINFLNSDAEQLVVVSLVEINLEDRSSP